MNELSMTNVDADGRTWFPFIGFTIAGKPVPWARHEGMGKSAHSRPAQKSFKNTIAQNAWTEMLSAFTPRDRDPRDGIEFRQQCRIYVPLTKAMEKRYAGDMPELTKQAIDRSELYCIERPDLDNWIKLPMDALNKLVWKDDGQVVNFDGSGKFYSFKPRLELQILTLEDLRK